MSGERLDLAHEDERLRFGVGKTGTTLGHWARWGNSASTTP
ncbi:hypothetical protein ACIRRA_37810 [Nocardia sp. NPDC101769]